MHLPRRSYSIDRSPGAGSLSSPASQRKDLGRSESLRVVCRPHRIFRPSDLIHGEVLGKGCFGQAIKVRGTPVQGWGGGPGETCPSFCLPPLPPGTHSGRVTQLPDSLARTLIRLGFPDLVSGGGGYHFRETQNFMWRMWLEDGGWDPEGSFPRPCTEPEANPNCLPLPTPPQ